MEADEVSHEILFLTDTTQSSPCTGLLWITPWSTETFTECMYTCMYLKHINSINLLKYNNVVHLYRLGNTGLSTWSSIALQTLSTVSLSGCLPLCKLTFFSLELFCFPFQLIGPHSVVGPSQHLEEGVKVFISFAT